VEDEGPLRGPGGGRVRRRPLRKERRRRKQTMADYLVIAVLLALIAFPLEYFVFKVSALEAAISALSIVVVYVVWSMFLDRWRARRAAQQKPRR
jgi:hypothetical protein